MWTRTENGSVEKPGRVERSNGQVILRKNFRFVEETEEKPGHYEYDEWQMSAEQYEVYCDFEERIRNQEDALIELAGLI